MSRYVTVQKFADGPIPDGATDDDQEGAGILCERCGIALMPERSECVAGGVVAAFLERHIGHNGGSLLMVNEYEPGTFVSVGRVRQ